MKKIFLLFSFTLFFGLLAFSQARKPTLMVVPSEVWCNQNGYMMEFDNQGVVEKLPDYNKVVQSDPDLILAISKIGELMAERGFPLKDLSACLRSIRNDAVEDSVTQSEDGDDLAESPLDKLKKVAKADIWLQLTYEVRTTGPKKEITFNLQGLDAYTNKQIAAASGTGDGTISSSVAVLLEEHISGHLENFNNQLDAFFKDLFENGREIKLTCKRWSGSDINFETEFDGEELGFLIEDWIADNTVQGRFSTQEAARNVMVFEQVRIPLYNDRGRAIDARNWANDLRKELNDKYGANAKLSIQGLGHAIITVGSK